MQRKFWIVISVIVVSVSAFYLYQRYRIQPLMGPPVTTKKHITRFHPANSQFCDELVARATGIIVVVQPVPQKPGERPSFENGGVDTSWEEELRHLAETYSTRAEHFMVLVDNPNLDQKYRSQLNDQIEGALRVDDVCVVDLSHPRSWYPIPPQYLAFGCNSCTDLR